MKFGGLYPQVTTLWTYIEIDERGGIQNAEVISDFYRRMGRLGAAACTSRNGLRFYSARLAKNTKPNGLDECDGRIFGAFFSSGPGCVGRVWWRHRADPGTV